MISLGEAGVAPPQSVSMEPTAPNTPPVTKAGGDIFRGAISVAGDALAQAVHEVGSNFHRAKDKFLAVGDAMTATIFPPPLRLELQPIDPDSGTTSQLNLRRETQAYPRIGNSGGKKDILFMAKNKTSSKNNPPPINLAEAESRFQQTRVEDAFTALHENGQDPVALTKQFMKANNLTKLEPNVLNRLYKWLVSFLK